MNVLANQNAHAGKIVLLNALVDRPTLLTLS
jgi:hypothetical protein